jgi:hypothetical protein
MDVGDWLRKLGLEQYEAAFRENEIDSGCSRASRRRTVGGCGDAEDAEGKRPQA